jgi:hypothetical protein
LKGDLAFQLLYLGGPTETVFKADEKKKLRLIFRSVFGLKSKLGFPCQDADEKLMVRSLLYRRDQLIKEIISYDEGDSQDAHARYMRDHLEALNKLIDEQIPTSTEKCVDTEPEDPNAPAKVGNLTEERMLRLLEIFAFLLAQGRDPLSELKDDLPKPGDILPRMAKAGAPGLRDYEQIYQTEMGTSPNFGPTLRKLKKVLSTNPGDDTVNFSDNEIKEFITNLSEIENLFGIPNEGTPTERKAAILDMIKHILTPVEAELGIDSESSAATIEDIDSRQEAIVNEIKKLKQELEDCIQKEGSSGSALAAANAKVAALEADVATKDTKIVELEGKITDLTQQLRDAKLAAAAAATAASTGVGVGSGPGIRRSTRSSSPIPGPTTPDPALVAAQAEVARLTTEATQLTAEVARLTAELAARTGERDALIVERDRLTTDLATARADLVTVRADLVRVEGERDTMRGERNTARGERDTAQARIPVLEAELAAAQAAAGRVAGLEAELAAERVVAGRVAGLEADLAAAQATAGRVAGLEIDLAAAQAAAGRVAGLEADLAAAQAAAGRVAGLEADLAAAQAAAGRVGGLEADLAAAQAAAGRVGGLEAEISQLIAERDACTESLRILRAERDAAAAAAAPAAAAPVAAAAAAAPADDAAVRQGLIDSAQRQIAFLERQLIRIEEALREADARARTLVNERDQAQERLRNTEDEMPQLRRQAAESRQRLNTITNLERRISELEAERDRLRDESNSREAARLAAVAAADAANQARDNANAAAAAAAQAAATAAQEAAAAAATALGEARASGTASAAEISRLGEASREAGAAAAAARAAQEAAVARAEAAERDAAAAAQQAAAAAQQAAAAAEADKETLRRQAAAAEAARTAAEAEAARLALLINDLQRRLAAAEAASRDGQDNADERNRLAAAAADELQRLQNALAAVEAESRAVHARLAEAEAALAARPNAEEIQRLKEYIRTLAGILGIDSSTGLDVIKETITSTITKRNERIAKLDRLLAIIWNGLKAFIQRSGDLENDFELGDLPTNIDDGFIDSIRGRIGQLKLKQQPQEDLLSPCLLNTLHYILFSQFPRSLLDMLEELDLTGAESELNTLFLKVVKGIKTNQLQMDDQYRDLLPLFTGLLRTNNEILVRNKELLESVLPTLQTFVGNGEFINYNLDPTQLTYARNGSSVLLTMMFLAGFHNTIRSDENKARLTTAGCEYQEPNSIRVLVRPISPQAQGRKPAFKSGSAYEPPESVAPIGKERPSLAQALGFGKK